jgi:hypothetical protein
LAALELGRIHAQVRYAAHVKEPAVADIYQTKEHMLANGAARHDSGALHIQMCLSEALGCAAVRTLSFRSRNVHGEYGA